MGKYDAVIVGLDPEPVQDLSRQQEIELLKEEIKAGVTHTPESLGKLLKAAREGSVDFVALDDDFKKQMMELLGEDGLESLRKEAGKKVEALEQMLAESCDRDDPGWGMYGAGPTTVRLPDGGKVAVQYEPSGKVEDKERFRLWCIANGYEQSLQLWPSTMNAIAKEKILNGEEAPDGVKVYVKTKVVLYKK